jgi:predicted DNA binding CopG/RHH family protein
MTLLDKEEQALSKSIEKGEWKSVADLEEERKKSKEYAKATFAKNQRMNIRIAQRDLDALKIKALEEGIPYQTLVSSIIRKYLSGTLVDKKRQG